MSTTWVTTLTYPVTADEDALVAMGEQLEEHDGSVASVPGRGVLVTVWGEAPSALAAGVDADHLVSKVLDLADPVAVETVTDLEHQARAERPTLPELVSAPEVADLLGVSRQRVHQLTATAAFPAPLFELRTGKIWDAAAVERFARDWTRKPGRPPKSA